MLNYFLYFLLCMFLSTCLCIDTFNENFNNFIITKIKHVNKELNLDILDDPITEREIHTNFEILSYKMVIFNNFSSPYLLSLFNRSYILDQNIYRIIPSDADISLDNLGNVGLFNYGVDFIRTIKYNNIEFILFSFEIGITEIYLARSVFNIRLTQSIKNPYYMKDSNFFINNNKLYLVTASSLGPSLGSISIYEWLGTYFDEKEKSLSTEARVIHTFSYKNSEIITVLQNSNQQHENSLVYEFKNNQLKKIQLLRTKNPYNMKKYTFNNQTYLIIFNEGYASLYEWQELEMVPIGEFTMSGFAKVVHLTYINSNPIIFAITQKEILVYKPTETLKLLVNKTSEKQFQNIMGIQTFKYLNKQFLYFFGRTADDQHGFTTIKFSLSSTVTDKTIYRKDSLSSCLSDLEGKLQKQQLELIRMQNETEKEKISSAHSVTELQRLMKKRQAQRRPDAKEKLLGSLYDEYDIHRTYIKVIDILDEIEPKMLNLFNKSDAVFKKRVTLLGNLEAAKMKATHITINTINSKEWTPDHWLSYLSEQVIQGNIKAKHIFTNELELPKGNIFEKALLLNKNRKIEVPVKFSTLRVTDLYADVVNDIPLDTLYFKGNPITINGTKTFNKLITDTLDIKHLNDKNASDIIKFFADTNNSYKFNSSVTIENLDVETINNLDWNTFKNSLFKIGEDNNITGNLTMKNIKVKNLNTQTVNGNYVKDFLTTTTDQTINSKMNFINMNTKTFNCSDINGINFATDLVTTLDEEKTIKGPVTVQKMFVSKNMHYNNTKADSGIFSDDFRDAHKQHLHQIYKKVKIIGNVRIENLHFQPNAEFILDKKEFNTQNSFNKYWLKHTDQIVPVHVKISKGISTPNLITNSLNGIDVVNYMRNDLKSKLPTTYYFENITIMGNVTLNYTQKHFPNPLELNETFVKLTGEYDVYGQKSFTGNLTVNIARIDYLDNIRTTEAATIYNEEISGEKEFEHLVIKGDLKVEGSYVYYLNGIELNTLYHKVMSTHTPVKLDIFTMENITVKSLEVKTLNRENINKYILNMDNLYAIKKLNNVEITSDTSVFDIIDLQWLNSINFNVIAKKALNEPVMMGNVKFLNNVYIKNLNTNFINNEDMSELTKNLMYRHSKQSITAKQYFNILRTPSLICDYINNLNMRDIIDTKRKDSQTLVLRNKLILKSAEFLRSLSGNLSCDFRLAAKSILNPPTRYWSSIKILKNMTVANEENILNLLLENAVRIGRDNLISSQVTLSQVTAKNVYTKKHINDVNIQEIYEDALLKNNEDALITGIKIFDKLTVAGATVHGQTDIPLINKLSIEKIDKSIIHKDKIHSTLIEGHKTFAKGLETSELYTSKILNISPEDIVSFQNLKPIPYTSFDILDILHNFNPLKVNGKRFTEFIENRILKVSSTKQILSGIYYFDNVHLSGNTFITTLNSINVDDVVTDENNQKISARKIFKKDLFILGNIGVNTFNNVDITEKYTNSILTNKDTQIDGNMTFEEASDITGNILAESINGISVEDIKAMLQSEKQNKKVKIVQDTTDKIKHIIEAHSEIGDKLPSQFMYLEKYMEFDNPISNAINSQVVETEKRVIIHVLIEKPGNTCGLPQPCKCLSQNIMQITPELSLHFLTSKTNQRVYSYEDDNVIAHLTTDNINYSSHCRILSSPPSNEFIVLTWTRVKDGYASTHKSKTINSYITGVEYFSMNNSLYVVINKFYDSRIDSHKLSCLVLKLDYNQKKVNVIQEIPTVASKVIHLIRSTVGIHLVIGNHFDSDNPLYSVSTAIYHFDDQLQQFLLLRQIYNTNCLLAASAVVGKETFLFLVLENARIVLYHFDEELGNYYFYQNFVLDSSVTSISVFYTKDFRNSDAFMCSVTETGNFYVFIFKNIEGWKLVIHEELEGLRILVPFNLNKQTYLFAPTSKNSSVLNVVKHGQN